MINATGNTSQLLPRQTVDSKAALWPAGGCITAHRVRKVGDQGHALGDGCQVTDLVGTLQQVKSHCNGISHIAWPGPLRERLQQLQGFLVGRAQLLCTESVRLWRGTKKGVVERHRRSTSDTRR